ncbi:carbohydrate ABC transporter permease [Vallitalea maricola]|uniref:Sugar ABC transporter permease n=1 Tax=Vallitalea maricola TaxID=3074433 RepID=A0ACB5UMG0_9FIRM|nr:sugar ABC transporter permease [Vallitalea sp. AN17-2]
MSVFKNKKVIFLFLFPALVFIIVFLHYPLVMSIAKSFTRWDGYFNTNFIGLANYRELLKDRSIMQSLQHTLKLMIYVIIFEVGFGLLLALFVDSVKKGAQFFRTVYFFPIVISGAAIGMLFTLIFQYYGGLLNGIIGKFGAAPIEWVTKSSAMNIVSIPTVWQYVGFYFVIMLTAINNVPEDIYESAYLDGITGITKTFYITIPMIADVIKVCLVLAITGVLKVFDIVQIMYEGGPLGSTEVLGTYMYRKAFTDERFGYACAISVLIVILGIILSVIVNKIFKTHNEY